MAAKNNPASSDFAEQEVVLTRLCHAPRDLVFRAWTEAEQLARWWGPTSFTNPVCETDPRPGGAWRIVMRGPDGTEYPCGGIYQEVVAPERLVFTNDATDAQGQPLLKGLTTVTFKALGNRTEVTVHMRAKPLVAIAVGMIQGMQMGWSQSLDRLAADTDEENPVATERDIVSTRVFAAPRDLVFRMWTEREHVGHWFGPRGFSLTIETMDVRPGGVWEFVMHGPDGVDYENKIVYVEVSPPGLLIYDLVSGPVFRMRVIFREENGQTRVTARLTFLTAAIRDKTVQEFNAVEGLKETLQRLGEHLPKA